MKSREVQKTPTNELFHELRQTLKSSWAVGFLAGICLAVLALENESLTTTEILALSGIVIGLVLVLMFQYRWATRRALPELEGRSFDVHPSIPEQTSDHSEAFRKRQRLSRFGMVLFLLSIPVFLVAAFLGFPPFMDSGFPALSGWLVIIGLVLPGLVLILRGVQCPACGNLLKESSGEKTQCPDCGARIR